jgi:YVTN family beta-propeller protein
MRLAERSTRASRRLVVFAASLTALSCGDSTGPGSNVVALQVTPEVVELDQTEEQQLAVAALDQEGLLVTGVSVRFQSSDPENLEVSPTGMIDASGASGSYYVRVTAGRVVKDVPVTVHAVIASVEATPAQVVLEQGGQVQIVPRVVDILGFEVDDIPVYYDVSNDGIVDVSPTGLVQSLGPRGTGYIAVFLGVDLPYRVLPYTVTAVPSALTIAPNPARVAPGRSFQLQAVVTDASGDPIPGPVATFSGGAPGIGTVNATGLVTAGATTGSFTVTATYKTLSAQATVEVAPVERPQGTVTQTIGGTSGGYGVAERDGIAYVAGTGGGLAKVSLATLQSVGTIPGSFADVRFSPDGDEAYAVEYGANALVVIDVASNSVKRSVPLPGDNIWSVEVGPGTGEVYVGGAGRIAVVDPDAGSVVTTLTGVGNVNHLSTHPTLPYIYASDFTGTRVLEIDATTRSVRRTITLPNSAQGTVVSPDGATLFVASESGVVFAVHLASGSVRQTGAPGTGGFGIALTKDGGELYVANWGSVVIVDAGTLTARTTLSVPGEARRATATGDGSMVLVASGSGVVVIQ